MKAVLLCAGYATRMGSLTANFPKALLPVAGRPILDDLVDQLEATGRIESVSVVTNHRDHAHFIPWRDARTRRSGSLPIELLDDGTTTNDDRLGAIGDLAWAIRTRGLVGPLLVVAGDNLFRFDWGAWRRDLDRALEAGASMVLLDHERDRARLRRSGVAEVDASGRLLRLHEKPADPPSEFCCPPLYLLSEQAVEAVPTCRAELPEADAPGHLIAWLATRMPILTHRMQGKRLDLGDAESYAAAESWLTDHPESATPAEQGPRS